MFKLNTAKDAEEHCVGSSWKDPECPITNFADPILKECVPPGSNVFSVQGACYDASIVPGTRKSNLGTWVSEHTTNPAISTPLAYDDITFIKQHDLKQWAETENITPERSIVSALNMIGRLNIVKTNGPVHALLYRNMKDVNTVQLGKLLAKVVTFVHGDALPAVYKHFVSCGADVNYANVYGYTALMAASLTGNTQAIDMLVEGGASVEAADVAGVTPLLFAAKGMNQAAMRTLQLKGADMMIKTRNGATALGLLLETLLRSMFNESFHNMDVTNRARIIRRIKRCTQFIISKGVDVNASETGRGNTTPLALLERACSHVLVESEPDQVVDELVSLTECLVAAGAVPYCGTPDRGSDIEVALRARLHPRVARVLRTANARGCSIN